MKKRLIALIIAVIALMSAAPAAAYATAPPPTGTIGGTLSIEYRFLEGQTPNIPEEITRFGFRYYLVSQSDPVLESTLPATRTYNYRIEGALTQEQLDDIAGLGQVTLTPSWLIVQREVDGEAFFEGLPTNDVDEIPQEWSFPVTQGNSDGKDTIVDKMLDLTGVTFEITDQEEGLPGMPSLPTEYSAIAVYRGVESYSVPAYYVADMLVRSEKESDVDVYVIVAEYRTNDMPPQAAIVERQTPQAPQAGQAEQAEQAGQGAQAPGGAPAEDQVHPDASTEDLVREIPDKIVPQNSFDSTRGWSPLSTALCVAAVAIAALLAFVMIAKRKRANNNS